MVRFKPVGRLAAVYVWPSKMRMNELRIFRDNALLSVLGMVALLAMPAFAAPAACPTSIAPITRTFSGAGAPTWTVNAPGSSTVNNLAGLTTAGTTGCFATDLTFSAFAVSSISTGTLDSPAPTAAGTYLAQSPNADTLLFSGLQGAGTGADGAQDDGTDNLKVDTTETLSSTLSYAVQDSKSSGLFGIGLTINGITVNTGGSGTVTLDTCSKTTSIATGITTLAACTTAGGTWLTSTAIALVQGQTQNVSLSFGATHPAFVDVTEIFSLACTSCTTTETGLLSFDNQFAEAPEPSTFGLLGTALAGIGAMAFRKRRVRS
jgi:hypothetical protein